jgi:hypothetical protein
MCDSEGRILGMSGARIFDFTGALPHMLDQLPVAPGAGPFDLGWRSGCLFVTATPLMKNAGRGAIEGFVTKFTTEVGFGGSVVREFMDASEFASGAWFFANAAWVVVKVMFLLGLGGRCKKFRAWRICAHPERFCRTCDKFLRLLWSARSVSERPNGGSV